VVVVAFNLMHLLVVVPLGPVPEYILTVELLVLVALVEVLVLLPVAQTEPAEFVSTAPRTLVAGHVVAALVLLDVLVTLGAGLGVEQDPIHVFAFRVVLVDPLF